MDELQLIATITSLPVNGMLVFAIWKLWSKIEKRDEYLEAMMSKFVNQSTDSGTDKYTPKK